MIYATEKSAETVYHGAVKSNALSNSTRLLLSTYAQALNKQENRSGSLFTQNTCAKALDPNKPGDYVTTCFHYIHQNPFRAGLVESLSDWGYSSFRDFAELRGGTLCNQKLAKAVVDVDFDNFLSESMVLVDGEKVKKLF